MMPRRIYSHTSAAIDLARLHWLHLRRVCQIDGPQRPYNVRECERARRALIQAIRGTR